MTDEFDDELREALRARAGGAVGTTSAHEAVLGRAAAIRRRRAVAAGSAALVLVALGTLVLLPRGRDDRIAPADDITVSSVDATDVDEDAGDAIPTSTVDTHDTHDTDDGSTSTTADTASTTVAPRTTVLQGGIATTAAPPVAPATGIEGTTPSTITTTTTTTATNRATTTAAPTTAATTSPTTTATDPPGTPPFTTTYESSGGSITVDWNGTSLSLLSVDPAAGYAAEIEDRTSSRIRVRFRGDDDARIEIRADDGRVEEIIS